MAESNDQSKKNLRPIAVGFFLIIFTVAVFFLKQSFFQPEKEALPENAADAQSENAMKFDSLSSSDLLKKINSNELITVLDIRDPESFGIEHITDSKNISLENPGADLVSLQKDREYVIVDDLGLTPNEMQIMKNMKDEGFSKFSFLEGGFLEWKNGLNPAVTAGDPYSFTDQSKVIYIKSDELNDLILKKEKLYIIDLRKKNEFSQEHISDAINISLDSLESRRKEIPLGKRIILYDQNGILAFQGAVRLFDMGIMNVYALSDGFDAWKQKGFATTSENQIERK